MRLLIPKATFKEEDLPARGAGGTEARPGAGGRSADVVNEDRFWQRDPPRIFNESHVIRYTFDARGIVFVSYPIFQE